MVIIKAGLLAAVGITAAALTLNVQAQGSTVYGSFVADPGKSQMTTMRKGCGSRKEQAYYHQIELMSDNKFVESIYISGIHTPDLSLTGRWSETKPNRVLLSYDGALNEGADGDNTGWAVLLGDIERQLSEQCEVAGMSLISAATRLKANTLKVNRSGTKAKLKLNLKSRSEGGYTKPKAAARIVSAQGKYERNSR